MSDVLAGRGGCPKNEQFETSLVHKFVKEKWCGDDDGTYDSAAERRDGVSFSRLLWVGPVTVVVALLVNLAIKTLLQALDPSLEEMGQLGRPLVILTLEGAILAVLVFALMVGWRRPDPLVPHRGRDRTW